MQGSERKALGEIQPCVGFCAVGGRWRCTFRRGTSVAIASVPRGGGGCLLGGQVTGTAPRRVGAYTLSPGARRRSRSGFVP